MNLSTEQEAELEQLIQNELASAQALLQILEQEYQILNSGDAETLETITQEKVGGMSDLQQRLTARNLFLSECAIEGVGATEALISSLPADTGITSDWQQLKDIAARLKQQNEINGAIISIGQRNTHNALDILSGRQPDAATTYNLDGERQRDNGSSTLIKV